MDSEIFFNYCEKLLITNVFHDFNFNLNNFIPQMFKMKIKMVQLILKQRYINLKVHLFVYNKRFLQF